MENQSFSGRTGQRTVWKTRRHILKNFCANLLLVFGFIFLYFNFHSSSQIQISSQNFFFLSGSEKGGDLSSPSESEKGNSSFVPTIIEDGIIKDMRNLDAFQKMMPSDREGSSAFLTEGGIVDQKEARFQILCNLQRSQHCYSKTIAEHIDLVWAFSPICTTFPNKMPELYKTHANYVGYLKSFGITSIVLEAIYPGQDFKVTTAGNEPWEIQLEVKDYIYYRENLVNVAVRKTKHLDYDYIIWLDSHQIFLNSYWWEDGIYKMARYPTVSFFHDLAHVKNPGDNSTMREGTDQPGVQYVYQHTSDIHYWLNGYGGWKAWNGNAVGVRREIYDQIEYIADYCIVGCCDCVFNDATMTYHWNLMDSFGSYGKAMQPWIIAARKVLGGENGVVRGRLFHLYHEHIRYDGSTTKKLVKYPNLNLLEELYRDENFTIRIKNESFLKRIMTKPSNSFPVY